MSYIISSTCWTTSSFLHRYDSEEALTSIFLPYLNITGNFFFYTTSSTHTATYLLILVILPSLLLYLIYLSSDIIIDPTPIFILIRFFSFTSFIVATTGNLVVDLGCRDQLSITSVINNRSFELVFVWKFTPTKNYRTLLSNSFSIHESNRAKWESPQYLTDQK